MLYILYLIPLVAIWFLGHHYSESIHYITESFLLDATLIIAVIFTLIFASLVSLVTKSVDTGYYPLKELINHHQYTLFLIRRFKLKRIFSAHVTFKIYGSSIEQFVKTTLKLKKTFKKQLLATMLLYSNFLFRKKLFFLRFYKKILVLNLTRTFYLALQNNAISIY